MGTGLEDLRVLQGAEKVADELWGCILKWSPFARDVIGKQLAKAADSVGANIAESYGRFHYGEKLQFLYYARGSLFETKYWLNRCQARGLLPTPQIQSFAKQLTDIARQLNSFANSLKDQKQAKSKTLREPSPEYQTTPPLFDQIELNWLSTTNLQSPISNPFSPNPTYEK